MFESLASETENPDRAFGLWSIPIVVSSDRLYALSGRSVFVPIVAYSLIHRTRVHQP